MNILLVSNLYPPIVQGGAEIYVGRLAQALAEADHRVVVVSTESGLHLAPRRVVSPEGIIVYRLAPLNIAHLTRLPHRLVPQALFRAIDLYHPQVAGTMTAIVRREQPDLVHIHNWVGLSLAALLSGVPTSAPHIPVAMTLHDYSLVCAYASIRHPDSHMCRPDFPCRLLTAVNQHVTGQVGLILSPSRYVLEEHLRRGLFGHALQQVLPYGLSTDKSPSAPVGQVSPPPLVRESQGAGQISPTPRAGEGQGGGYARPTFDILFLGRVQWHKGIDVLIHAFRRLDDDSLRLHIAGTGPSLEFCKTIAEGDDRIRFYGFVSGELRRSLLENADCMVLPSLWPDNYPVSIQEAFFAGLVVIASRIGGIPEMVRDGINGLLVAPGDEAGIAAAIERLRDDPGLTGRLRAAAKETAHLYDMHLHVARLTEAYQRLLVSDRLRPFDQRAA